MNKATTQINRFLAGKPINKDKLFNLQKEVEAIGLALHAIQSADDHHKGANHKRNCIEAVERQLVKINKLKGE